MSIKGFYDNDIYSEGESFNLYKKEKEKGQALKDFEVDEKVEIKLFPTFEIAFLKDTGFGVYDCSLIIDGDEEEPDTFIMTGNFLTQLDIGHSYSAIGTITIHEDQKQLLINKIVKIKPTNKASIVSLISSLPNGSVFAELIYSEYKDKSIDIIIEKPELIEKLSPSLYKELILDWQGLLKSSKTDEEFINILKEYGLSDNEAKYLYKKHGMKSINKIESNPYFLSKELPNYGFKKSDNIALKLGYLPFGEDRVKVGILYVLNSAKAMDGHIYLPKNELFERAKDLLDIKLTYSEIINYIDKYKGHESFYHYFGKFKIEINYAKLEESLKKYEAAKSNYDKLKARYTITEINDEILNKAIDKLNKEEEIYIIKNNIYSKRSYIQERNIANNIRNIMSMEKKFDIDIKSYLDNYLKIKNIILEKEQYQAVLSASSSMGGFFVIDGSAGCGKTFILKIILDILKEQYINEQGYFNTILMAPTGKAAKVISNATKKDAKTVHRALGYNPKEGFKYNARNRVIADCVILDESSMLDLNMTHALLEAIPNTTKVIFIGDTKQLASVGPGNILKDIILSNKVNISTLTVTKRQGTDSGIIQNALKILKKEMIETNHETNDTFVVEKNNDKEGLVTILQFFYTLVKKYGIQNTQILSPQKAGIIGVNTFNYYIQKAYNKNKAIPAYYYKNIDVLDINTNKNINVPMYFKEGDKVMNVTNEYDIPVYKKVENKLILNDKAEGIMNGDLGIIVKLIKDNNDSLMLVQFEDKYVFFKNDFSSLELAYAMTIHKSQGSEWKAVLLPIFKSHYNMLDNHLFYTGYTRASEVAVVVHDEVGIKTALESTKSTERYTSLNEQLINAFNN